MPPPDMFLPAPQGELEFVAPGCLLNPETNVLGEAFTAEMDVEHWEDWMKWEAAELELPQSYRANSFALPETWSSDHDSSSRREERLCTYFPGAPFAVDNNATLSSTIMPPDLTTALSLADLQPPAYARRFFRGFSSLTESEEQDLKDIAMPSRMLSAVKLKSEPTSPNSSTSDHSPSPSPSPSPEPETRTRKTRKRKGSRDHVAMPNALSQSRKKGHNAIEKRYRTNLNDKINCLRLGIPSVSTLSDLEGELDSEDILTSALEYIQHLETTTNKFGSQLDVLKTRVGAFETLAVRGSVVVSNSSNCLGAQSILVQTKSETLEIIQEDFKQINAKTKAPRS